jgi:phosphatidylethanolamine/phosphatidyl-N-methylethanolamine N-methyltransferase
MLLPKHVVGNVTSVVSGIPMMNLSLSHQARLISSWKKVLSPRGSIIQFTYGPLSSLPAERLGLIKKRLGHVLRNFPPATVWKYFINEKKRRVKTSLRSRFKLFVNEELKKVSRIR